MTPSPPRRAFLSHTSELRSYPAERSFVTAAEGAVIRAGDALTDMAYFTARDAAPAEYCASLMAAADIYVGIIGLRYGTAVPGRPRQSYTELEFETATELGLARLVFLVDERVRPALLASNTVDPEQDERQMAFRRRLEQSGVTAARIATPAELELGLYQALVELPAACPTAAWLRDPVGAYLCARDQLNARLRRALA